MKINSFFLSLFCLLSLSKITAMDQMHLANSEAAEAEIATISRSLTDCATQEEFYTQAFAQHDKAIELLAQQGTPQARPVVNLIHVVPLGRNPEKRMQCHPDFLSNSIIATPQKLEQRIAHAQNLTHKNILTALRYEQNFIHATPESKAYHDTLCMHVEQLCRAELALQRTAATRNKLIHRAHFIARNCRSLYAHSLLANVYQYGAYGVSINQDLAQFHFNAAQAIRQQQQAATVADALKTQHLTQEPSTSTQIESPSKPEASTMLPILRSIFAQAGVAAKTPTPSVPTSISNPTDLPPLPAPQAASSSTAPQKELFDKTEFPPLPIPQAASSSAAPQAQQLPIDDSLIKICAPSEPVVYGTAPDEAIKNKYAKKPKQPNIIFKMAANEQKSSTRKKKSKKKESQPEAQTISQEKALETTQPTEPVLEETDPYRLLEQAQTCQLSTKKRILLCKAVEAGPNDKNFPTGTIAYQLAQEYKADEAEDYTYNYLHMLSIACNHHHIPALQELSEHYVQNNNLTEAAPLLEKLFDLDEKPAHERASYYKLLGDHYAHQKSSGKKQKNTTDDGSKSKKYHEKAIANGNTELLTDYLHENYATSEAHKDEILRAAAERIITIAQTNEYAENSLKKAHFILGNLYLKKKNLIDALAEYKQAGTQGLFQAGVIYAELLETNYAQALELFEACAKNARQTDFANAKEYEKALQKAQANMLYCKGKLIQETDPKAAYELFRQSSLMGHFAGKFLELQYAIEMDAIHDKDCAKTIQELNDLAQQRENFPDHPSITADKIQLMIGEIYCLEGQIQKAKTLFAKLLDKAKKHNDKDLSCQIHLTLGQTYAATACTEKQRKICINNLIEALRHSTSTGGQSDSLSSVQKKVHRIALQIICDEMLSDFLDDDEDDANNLALHACQAAYEQFTHAELEQFYPTLYKELVDTLTHSNNPELKKEGLYLYAEAGIYNFDRLWHAFNILKKKFDAKNTAIYEKQLRDTLRNSSPYGADAALPESTLDKNAKLIVLRNLADTTPESDFSTDDLNDLIVYSEYISAHYADDFDVTKKAYALLMSAPRKYPAHQQELQKCADKLEKNLHYLNNLRLQIIQKCDAVSKQALAAEAAGKLFQARKLLLRIEEKDAGAVNACSIWHKLGCLFLKHTEDAPRDYAAAKMFFTKIVTLEQETEFIDDAQKKLTFIALMEKREAEKQAEQNSKKEK